jgi:hypothetical protein
LEVFNETRVQEVMFPSAASKKKAKGHGCTRSNSGSKPNAKRLGLPKERGTIGSYFGTQKKTIGAPKMSDEAANANANNTTGTNAWPFSSSAIFILSTVAAPPQPECTWDANSF